MTRLYTFALVLFLRLTATPRRLISVSVTAFLVVMLCIASSTYGAIADAPTGVIDGLTPVAPPAGMPTGAAEQPALRTANSQTFALPGGINEAVISQTPVNYQDSQGRWQPIDTSLVSGSSGYSNAANSFSLTVPVNGKNPVQLTAGSASIGISVDGASGTTSASGSTATVANALPGLSLRYTSLPDGVADDLVASSLVALTTPLSGSSGGASPLGPSSGAKATAIGFRVSLAAGMTLRVEHDGSVDAVDTSGASKFVILPAVMEDAAGAISPAQGYSVAPNADGTWELSLTPDLAWLSTASRAWPVTIDPTVTISDTRSASSSCSLASDFATSNYCTASTESVGNDGTGNWRTAFSFGLSGLSPLISVISANLNLTLTSTTNGNATSVTAYPITNPNWDSGVTWNTYDGTSSWTTAGGDFSSAVDNAVTWSSGTTLSVPVTNIVQGWLNGSLANDGVIVKATSEPASNLLTFDGVSCGCGNKPSLNVFYLPATGIQPAYTYDSYRLGDRTNLSVNVANGDLVLANQDVSLVGVGIPMTLTRYYDSLSAEGVSGAYGELTDGWRMAPGEGMVLYEEGENATVVTPADDVEVWEEPSSHTYIAPPGIDADLTYNSSPNTYTLEQNHTGDTLTYSHTSQGFYILTSIEDANGNTITYTYGSSGPSTDPITVSSISDTFGNSTTFSYNSSGELTQVSDPFSRTYSYGTVGSGELPSYTDPNSKTWSYGYDTGGADLLETIKDPLGNETSITYDSSQRVTSVTRGLDAATGLCDFSGDICPETQYAYISPLDSHCSSVANAVGETKLTDARSHAWYYCYDSAMRILQKEDPDGDTTSTTYSGAPAGNNCTDNDVCTSTDALGDTSTYGYSAANATTGVLQGENGDWSQTPLETSSNRMTDAYTDSANPWSVTSTTDAEGNTWQYVYDSHGNLCAKTEGSGGSPTCTTGGTNAIRFTYNSDGTIATITDAKGNTTSYCYGAAPNQCTGTTTHLLTKIVPPSPLGATVITYDSDNRISTVTDGASNKRTYTYDALDRVTDVKYGTGSPDYSYVFDADGNQKSLTTGGSTYNSTFDNLNMLRAEDVFSSGSIVTVHYTYDLHGNLTDFKDVAGNDTTYSYGNENQLTAMTQPGVSGSIAFGYNADLNQASIEYPTSTPTYVCYSYDASQRITAVVSFASATATCTSPPSTTITKFTYSYTNGSGADTDQQQSMTAQYGSGSTTTTYDCYDPLERLASVGTGSTCPTSATSTCSGNGTTWANSSNSDRYAYDVNGNMCSMTESGSTSTFTLNAANEITNTNYAFDGDGSQTNDNSVFSSASYSHPEQMTSVTPTGGSSLNMAYDNVGQIRRDRDGTAKMTVDSLDLEKTVQGTTNIWFTRLPDGTIVGERIGTSSLSPYYFAFDRLGSVVAVIDSSGTAQNLFSYTPYGTKSCTGGSSCSVRDPIQFAGGYSDASDGNENLIQFDNRFYDPTMGRWTEADPVNMPLTVQGWNQYDYANDNPINCTDPDGSRASGLSCKVICALTAAAMASHVVAACAACHKSHYQDILACDECRNAPDEFRAIGIWYAICMAGCNSGSGSYKPWKWPKIKLPPVGEPAPA